MRIVEVSGVWWLPCAPTRRVSGVVTMTPKEHPVLELHGSFSETRAVGDSFTGGFEKFGLICGSSIDGKAVTLQGCVVRDISISTARSSGDDKTFVVTKMFVEKIFFGHHFLEEPAFSEVVFELPYLSHWLNKKTFSVQRETDEGVAISFTPWECVCFVDDVKISFFAGSSIGESFGASSSHRVSKTACVRITCGSKIPYAQLERYVWGIHNFLDFVTGEDSFPSKIKGVVHDTNKHTVPEEVEIIIPAKNNYRGENSSVAALMPLPFDYMEKNLGEVIAKWFEKRKSFEWLFNLYFGYRRNKNSFLNDQFLALARALEVYCNRTVSGHMDEETYKREVRRFLYEAIPSHLGDDFKNDLKNQLRYGYQKRLRSKIKAVYRKKMDVYGGLNINENFIGRVVKTRDYLTHFSDDDTDIFSWAETARATIVLRAMVELCILEEVGFGDVVLKRFVEWYKAKYKPVFQ